MISTTSMGNAVVEEGSETRYSQPTMRTVEVPVTRIGNSRGVKLPASTLRRYKIGEVMLLEERPDEIVLRPKRARSQKSSWEQTYKEMAKSDEDWSDWESLPDGLDNIPGDETK
jgi:antitoxin MazE